MTYGIPVYGMTSGKTVSPAEIGLPAIVFLQNFERCEGQQNQKDWQRKIQNKKTNSIRNKMSQTKLECK